MLTQLLAHRLEAVEELASADWSRHICPGGPEVLHPAQGTAVQQDFGLGRLYKEKLYLKLRIVKDASMIKLEGTKYKIFKYKYQCSNAG